jgi:hypothetical protein
VFGSLRRYGELKLNRSHRNMLGNTLGEVVAVE